MKTTATIILFLIAFGIYAQKQTYEFVTYTPPSGWKKEVKQNEYTSYTTTNSQNNSYCQIFIMLSTNSKGGIDQDFESEWQGLIVKNYGVTEAPNATESTSENGWTAKAGVANFSFNNGTSMAILTTMSGYNKAVSIIALTNNEAYMPTIQTFLESVEMGKPQNNTNVVSNSNNNNADNSFIISTWKSSSTEQSNWRENNGVMNSVSRQYIFNDNGTYNFYCKSFDPLMNEILLTRESGTYQISGSTISVVPQKCAVEAWTKKDGTDKFGKLISSKNCPLEKTSYLFTNHYFSGIQQWNLVLQADQQTQRDGPFSNNKSYSNAWYYKPISANNPLIELP